MALKEAGALRHWVDILQPQESEVSDAYGRRPLEYVRIARMPCAVADMSTREYMAQQAGMREKTVTFSARYNKDIREDMRLRFGGQEFEILYINHLGYNGRYMDIKCRLIEGQAVSYGENQR